MAVNAIKGAASNRDRSNVAERLVEEAAHRQVVVFTHDLTFLFELTSKAEELGQSVTYQTVNPHKFPKGRRRPSAVNFVMTERDLAILEALGQYRYLRTGQISRLVFPQNTTVQSARRRLKYLFHAGYVGRIQPLENPELGVGEIAYFLEKQGRDLFDEETLPVFSQKSQVKPLFLRHALAVSEFRLNWTLATAAYPNVELHRIVMDSELKQRSDELVGRKRYKLFDELLDPIGKRKLIVHPDLLIIMRAELPSKKQAQRLFLVEVDRGIAYDLRQADRLPPLPT